MSKLFRVEITATYYMLARDDIEANLTAHRYAVSAVEDCELDGIDVAEVDRVADHEAEWADAIPYGERARNPDELTIGEWLEAKAAAEAGLGRPAPGQLNLGFADATTPESPR